MLGGVHTQAPTWHVWKRREGDGGVGCIPKRDGGAGAREDIDSVLAAPGPAVPCPDPWFGRPLHRRGAVQLRETENPQIWLRLS